MSARTVLIIDDEPHNVMLLEHLMESAGYSVLVAADAESGMAIARKGLPDLILLDIQLPGMSGIQAAEILRDDPQLRHIPVIAVSAHAQDWDSERAIQAGCREYITKPVDIRDLLGIVGSYLQPGLARAA